MLNNLLYLLILILGVFAGLFLSKICRDEIRAWRKRLFIMSIVSFVLIVLVFLIPIDIYYYKLPTIVTLLFIIVVDLTIVWKTQR